MSEDVTTNRLATIRASEESASTRITLYLVRLQDSLVRDCIEWIASITNHENDYIELCKVLAPGPKHSITAITNLPPCE